MKVDNCVPGAIVRPVKGSKDAIGVVQSVSGDTATVMFSVAGSDYVEDCDIHSDLDYPNVTAAFITEVKAQNA